MRHRAAIGLCLLLPGPFALAQDAPDWAMLAECSAVFGAVSRSDGYAGTEGQTLRDAGLLSARFLDQAVLAAGAAGQADAKGDVASIMGYLTERWDNRIESILSLRSNLDWIDYCNGLGRRYGVLPLAE